MWSRVNGMSVSKFKRNEDGAILVFFALACAAIFLVAALTFDIGRRASTQTELQSFTDHVALAAAGELNGFPGAIDRAKEAANQIISDSYVIGEGDQALGPGDFHIYFYETLPDDDEAPLVDELDQDSAASDPIARFVRVAMISDPARGDASGSIGKQVDVPWVFARLLSIFGTDTLPSTFVGAESVAGYTSLACDVAPVFFCLPENPLGPQYASDWDPAANVGQTIRLRDGDGGNGGPHWEPGNFTWLDIREQVPESVVDADGDCSGLSGNNLYECLFAAENGVTLCFENGNLVTLPGQKEGNVAAVFDTRFDIYSSSSNQVAGESRFRPAPVVNKAYEADGVCGGNQKATSTTSALPPDDCFRASPGAPLGDCANYTNELRYGDKDWSTGRLEYVHQNYSRDYPLDAFNPAEITAGGDVMIIDGREYHKYDPFRPEVTVGADYTADQLRDAGFVFRESDGTPTLTDGAETFDPVSVTKSAMLNRGFDPLDAEYIPNVGSYPIIPGPSLLTTGSTRWDYYRAEVAASLFDNPKLVFNPAGDPGTPLLDDDGQPILDEAGNEILVGGDQITTFNPGNIAHNTPPRELIRDIVDPYGPPSNTYDRLGASAPYCSTQAGGATNFSPSPKRRTLVAAGVNCGIEGISGKTTDVFAQHFIEVFLISPSDDDPLDNKKKEIFVEVIGPVSTPGLDNVRPGRFRNLVQLYRQKTLSQ